MREIITDIEKLSTASEPLKFINEEGTDKTEGTEIIQAIKEVMEANPELLALSAPQIGIQKRIFCLRFSDVIKTFIDPIVKQKKGINIALETCASMPGKEIVIGRPAEISVIYYNEDFKYEDNKLVGVAAGLFDQQVQILDGILPSELGLVSDIEEDGKIQEDELPDIAKFYKETFLPTKMKAVQEAVESDEDAKKAYRNLQFTEAVVNGRIKVVESEEETDRREKANKMTNKSIQNMNIISQRQQKAEFKNYVSRVSKRKR